MVIGEAFFQHIFSADTLILSFIHACVFKNIYYASKTRGTVRQ